MKCDHSDKRTWIGKADGVFCSVCGEKIDLSAKPVKKAPAKKVEEPAAEEPKKEPAKKAPAKKTTTGRAKK